MDYTAIGDTTNLAQRLQTVADPGMVLISDATHRLIRGFFEVLPARRFEVKGKREPVVAHEVRGLSETTTAIAVAEARGLTPLVGRNEELAQLIACFDRLARLAPAGGDRRRRSRQRQIAAHLRAEAAARRGAGRVLRGALLGDDARACRTRRGSRCCGNTSASRSDDGEAEAVRQDLRAARRERERSRGQLSRALPGDEPARRRQRRRGPRGRGRQARDVRGGLRPRLQEPASRPRWSWSSRTCIGSTSRRARCCRWPSAKTNRSRVMMLISHRPEHQPGWRVKSAFTQLTPRAALRRETVEIVRGRGGRPASRRARGPDRAEVRGQPVLHRGDHPHAGRGGLPAAERRPGASHPSRRRDPHAGNGRGADRRRVSIASGRRRSASCRSPPCSGASSTASS